MPEPGQGSNGQSHSAQPIDGLEQLPNVHFNNDRFSHQTPELNQPLPEQLHEP